jgi:hypothetical protein
MKGKGLTVKQWREKRANREIVLPESQLTMSIKPMDMIEIYLQLDGHSKEIKEFAQNMFSSGKTFKIDTSDIHGLSILRETLRIMVRPAIAHPVIVDFDETADEDKDEVGIDAFTVNDLFFIFNEVGGKQATDQFRQESTDGVDTGQPSPDLSPETIGDSGDSE